ncbi:Peptidase S10, serine carboxypeptidase [Cynara cardunculus var. scolymus]|uniref:Carboxypeptidase n=1 Tax=Cynara cardunculus var. scolymus TaxID=59895 RepID=A0A103XMR0_CYNCS|nr:Peptidase S10, serine carboxypeptidase [Cynara cardunculus var. scolymus]
MDGLWRKTSDMSVVVICLLFTSIFTNTDSLTNEQEKDRIKALPGQPEVAFSQFSGYVTVHKKHGRALFYWLTEAATHNPLENPLVLWLNGGPGCSSIAYGASEEIGPFRINETASSLYLNKYSWNKPRDALTFLKRWMSRFPQYRYRDFYLSGESYAGHYVPQLAKKIHDYNKNHSNPFINLKGFIVGNAVTDIKYDNIGTVAYWWSHSIISDSTYKSIMSSCKFTSAKYSQNCDDAINYAWNYEFGEIDQYSIYTPSCNKSSRNLTTNISSRVKNTLVRISGYDPCIENNAEKYYNRPDVQHAMHANSTGISYKWTACSGELLDNWKDSEFSMLPTYKKLIAAGYRIWIFSLSHLNLTVKTRWYPWYLNGQVGGWTEVYDGLTFATVRGAGHEVPLLQPQRGFLLFQSFLAGKNLPRS